MPRRRHHPSHAERGADLLDVAAAVRSGADHLLQRDDVGADVAEHAGDALGFGAAIHAAAAMNVVGDDAQQRRGVVSHYAMIDRDASRAPGRTGVGDRGAFAGCVDIPPDPLQLDRGMLTVDNHTSSDWNRRRNLDQPYYRVTVPTIAARGRFQVPLDAFVSGYAQRFDIHKAVIKDLRLTAKQPDGTPLVLDQARISTRASRRSDRKENSDGAAQVGTRSHLSRAARSTLVDRSESRPRRVARGAGARQQARVERRAADHRAKKRRGARRSSSSRSTRRRRAATRCRDVSKKRCVRRNQRAGHQTHARLRSGLTLVTGSNAKINKLWFRVFRGCSSDQNSRAAPSSARAAVIDRLASVMAVRYSMYRSSAA